MTQQKEIFIIGLRLPQTKTGATVQGKRSTNLRGGLGALYFAMPACKVLDRQVAENSSLVLARRSAKTASLIAAYHKGVKDKGGATGFLTVSPAHFRKTFSLFSRPFKARHTPEQPRGAGEIN